MSEFISHNQERRFFCPARTDDLKPSAAAWANKWVIVDGWHENVAMRGTHPECERVGFVHEFSLDVPESELLRVAPSRSAAPEPSTITVKGYGFVRGKLGQDGVVEKCAMYHYPHVCTPRWCSPPPEGHPPTCPECGSEHRAWYRGACEHEWHGGIKVPAVAMIPDDFAPISPASQVTRCTFAYNTKCGCPKCAAERKAEVEQASAAPPSEPRLEAFQELRDWAVTQLDMVHWQGQKAAVKDIVMRLIGKAEARAAAVPAPGSEELNCLSDLVDDCTRTIGVIDGVCSRLTKAKLLDAVVRLLMERSVSLTKSRDKFLQTALKESVVGATAPPKEG